MNNLKKLFFIVLLLVTARVQSQELPEGYKMGDIVSNFSLMNVDGTYRNLDQYLGSKGIIVIFTCNHCPYSQAYEQRIIDLDQKFAALGYPVIAINPNDAEQEPTDSYPEMVARSAEKGYTFPYLHDVVGDVAMQFGARRTPHVFLLKKEDVGFKLVYQGAIDDNTEDASKASKKYVEMAIAELEEGKEVSVNTTKAVGCTIKWTRNRPVNKPAEKDTEKGAEKGTVKGKEQKKGK